MLWHKAWLETRWRFLIGLALLVMLACGTVFDYPAVARLTPMVRDVDTTTAVGRAIREAAELERTYRGFIWLQWFRQNLGQTITLLAIILGSGGLLSTRSALFTLSLPISRARVLGRRAAAAAGELFVLAFVPSLLIPVLSPLVGQHYSVADVLVQSGCAFVGATAFLSAALLLSTVFTDVWRPLLMTCAAAVVFSILGHAVPALFRYGMFGAMVAEPYFRAGALPWPALIVSACASTAMLYGASINFVRRDF